MEKIKGIITELKKDPDILKQVYAVTLAAALIVLVMVIKGPEEQGSLVTDSSGNVVSISRHSMASNESYDVTVNIGTGTEAVQKDVTIALRGVSSGSGISAKTDDKDIRAAEIDAEIDRMLTELEYSEDETVTLPASLSDGTPVRWTARKQEDRTGIAFIPFMYIAFLIAVIKSGLDKRSDGEATARREIMKGLPRFCNQLFLMMNAGMILSDAVERICDSYRGYGEENMSVFERELSELIAENDGHRISTATLINEYASRHNVKELVRIATILTENERRGSDVIESLSRESSYLWDDRKIVARESGRMIDMKMSWPLGMLLILLIVITMAPALLSM